ncbi:MAG: glycosyltransferase family 39 protein [Abditibacteriales bacterium]|nr:glycosyltransferase family 39 protein [Abditibacteriales bacterium]MDW8365689.1 glycosyltransferase family 39 protein [Abditibacteriales bacterium]
MKTTGREIERLGNWEIGKLGDVQPSILNPQPFISLLLCLITAFVIGRHITVGGFWWSDASRHAMDGVFIYDFVRDGRWGDWREYALRYYAQYPALGFAFYPPFFAMVEAVFFAVFGISAFTARLTVLAFALVGVIWWQQWIQRLAGPLVAFVSAIFLITSPTVVLWAREVMLEMPALALLIAACCFVDRFVRSQNPRHLYLGVIMAGLAAWTKQTAVFIVPVLIVYLTLTEKPRFWLTRAARIAALWGVVLFAPLCAYILYFGGVAMDISVGDVNFGIPRFSWRAFTFYPTELPRAIGAPIVLLALIGLYMILRSPERQRWSLPLLWILGYYLFAWYVSIKQDRYIYFWLPPFALLAALALTRLATVRFVPRALAYSVVALFCGSRVVAAYAQPPRSVSGYDEAAAYIAAHPKGQVVLFDGYYGGNFIFEVRRHSPQKSLIVLRGDKMFNPIKAMRQVGEVRLVYSEADIRRLLKDYGVNQILVENGPPLSPASTMLRTLLRTSREFKEVKRWRLVSRDGHNIGDALTLYERKESIQPQRTDINLLVPAFDRRVKTPLQPLSEYLRRK